MSRSMPGPVGKKLVRLMRKERGKKLINFEALSAGDKQAKRYQDEVRLLASKELEPSHGWYSSAQNRLSIFVEQVDNFRESAVFTEPIADAQDEYMPLGPPMSPLTATYFFYWAVCDLSPLGDGETLASATLDLVREIGTDEHLLSAMETLANSRMGFWVHCGTDGSRVRLRELITGDEQTCCVPAGYLGQKGEVWFARVVPPGLPGLSAVVLTTPYLLIDSNEDDWMACFSRILSRFPTTEWLKIYPLLLKYGEQPNYWAEFVFESYSAHSPSVIELLGYPDIAESRPHSDTYKQ